MASFAHQPGHSAYSASKAGLEAMCNALRTEVAGTGVEVGTFHPGWIATPMVTEKNDHLVAFQRFRQSLPAPFNVTSEPGELAPKIADAFAQRKRRLVYPRAGWLAHVARPRLTLPLLTLRTRAAAPEIRQLFIEQTEAEGNTVGMSHRYSPRPNRT